MKIKHFTYCLLFAFAYLLTSCNYVDPKEVCLRVHEMGDNAGEIEIQKVPGRYSHPGIEASDYCFPTIEQNYRWTEDVQVDFGSETDESIKLQIEGNDCKLDVGIRFYVDNTNDVGLKHLVTKYPTDLDGIVDGLLFDLVRGGVKETLKGKPLDDVIDNLSTYMRGPISEWVSTKGKEYAITVVEVYDISGVNAPESVMQRKKETQEAGQQIEKARKQQEEEAIRNQIMIDKATAEAAANKIRNNNAPNANVLEQMKIEKWDGVLPVGSNAIILKNN